MANEIRLRLAIEGGQLVGATLDGVGNRLDALDSRAQSAAQAMRSMTGAAKIAANSFGAAFDSIKTFASNSAAAIGASFQSIKNSDIAKSITEGVKSGIEKTKTMLGDLADFVENKLIIAGVAIAVGVTAAFASAVYAAYKATDFAVGLLTGESYKSANIDALISMTAEVTKLQNILPLTATGASALNQALALQGVSASEYASVINSVSTALRSNTEEFDRLGVSYKNANGSIKSTEEILKSAEKVLSEYADGWDRSQAATALGLGSLKDIQTALSVSSEKIEIAKDRLIAYGLVIGEGTQEAVEKYKTAMRGFQNESDLTSQGFKAAIAGNIMPVLTDLAEFFTEGFPFAVRAFRSSMAVVTSLFYGLKTVVYLVTESIVGSISAIGSGLGGLASAATLALTGDFSGAKSALIGGWEDAKKRLGGIGDNIVTQARNNSKAMALAWGADSIGANNAANNVEKVGKAWKAAPIAEEAAKAGKATKELADEYQKLSDEMSKSAAMAQAEIDSKGALSEADKYRESMLEKLIQSYQNGKISIEQYIELESKMTDVEGLVAQAEAHKNLGKAVSEALAWAKKETDAESARITQLRAAEKAVTDYAQSTQDAADALEYETGLVGLNIDERKRLIDVYKAQADVEKKIAEIKADTRYNGDETGAQEAAIAAVRVASAQATATASGRAALTEWQKTADGISDALTNAFMGAIDGTKSAWVSLRDGIVNMFKTMVLRPQIQAIMNPISGAITSSLFGTAANAATGASATSGLIGTGGTIANWFTPVNTAISQFGVAALESTQALFGLANAGTAATISELAGTSSLASQLGGAVPYAAIALLAAAVIDKIANAGEQRFGASYTADATGKATLQNAPSGGEIVAKTARDIFEATQKNINQVLKDIGSNATVAGFVAGLESSGDGKGFAYAGGTIDGKGFGDYKGRDGGQFAMGSRSAEQALVDYANEMRKATLEALQAATDIPATISEQLAGVNIDSLTGEQLTALESAVGKTIAEIKATITGLQALPIAGFSDLSANAAGNLIKASGGFDKLNTSVTAYYSGFVSDNDKLAKTFASTGESFGKLGLAMPGVNGGLKDWYEGAVDAAAAMDLTKPANAQHLADLLASAEAMNAVLGPMDAFSESMQALPWQFDMLKNMSYEAATGLAAAAGGFDALAGNLNSFYSNFYTEEERSAQSLSTLAAGFTQIGLAMPAVDSGLASWYRAAVETSLALDQSVPGNAAFTASLLAMNGAVASAVKTNTSMAGSAKDSAAAGINAVKAVDTSSLALDNLAQAAQSPAEKLAATSESLDTAASAAAGLTSAINPVASAFSSAASGITDAVNAINALTITNPAATAATLDGSHAGGLAYVPFDGYLAELHRGERVLTASEASRMAMTTRDAATDTGATEVIDATSDYAKALKAVADEIKGFVDDLADIGKSPFTLALEKIHDEAIKRAEELANASKAPSGDAGGNNSIPSNFFYNLETSYSNQLNKILTGNIRGSDSLNVALGYQSSIDMMLRNAASLDNKSLSFSGTPQTESQRSEYMKMYQNYSGDIFGQVESAIKDAANGGKSIADLVTEIRARDSNGNGLIQAQNINLANLIEKYATSDLIKKVQEEESKKNYTYTGGQDYSQAFQAIKDLADGKLNGTDQETAKMFIARDFDKWFKTRQSDDIRDSAGINNQVQPKIADLLRARIPTVIGDDGLPVYKNVTQSEIDTGKEFLTGQIEAIVKNSLDGTKSIADSLEEMRINGVGDYADIAKQVLTPEYMAKAAAAAAAGDNSYAGGAELVSTLEEFYKSLGLEIGGDTGSGSDAIDPTIAAWEKAQTELLYATEKQKLTEQYDAGTTSTQAKASLNNLGYDVTGLSAEGIQKYFADILAAANPLTEEGQKTIKNLTDLGDNIALLGQIASERQSWQDKLDVLTGATTEQALQRQKDLASTTDAATIAIIKQVQAQEDAAKVAAATQDYTLQMLAAQGESGAAELKALERNIDAKEKLEAGWTQTQIDSLNSVLDAAEAEADAAELLNTKLDLQATLFELTGDKLAAAAVLEAQRNIELAALDPTLRSLQTEIWGLQDAAEAAAKATEATNLKKNWQDQLDTLLDTTGATGRRIALEKDLATTTDAGTQALIRHFHAQTNYNTALANLETAKGAVKSVQDRGTDAYLSALSAQESAQQAIADIAKTAAKETYNAAMALRELGKTLREYATEQTAAPSARFADLLKKALTGDKEAMQGLTSAASSASTQAKEQASNVALAQARIMAGVMQAALLAEATALPENPEVDPLIAANEALTKANTDVADALRVANAIQASLTKSVDDLIKEYADAKAKQVTAQTEFDAAKQVLEDIKNNTANTNISVTDLNGKLVTELTVTAKSEIEKLIKFVSNTDKLPADLKALALSAGDAFNKTVSFILGSDISEYNKKFALAAATDFARVYNLVAGSDLSAELKKHAFDTVTAFNRTINVIAGATLPADIVTQAFGATTNLNRMVEIVAGSSLSGPLKIQAFGLGEKISRVIELVATSASMPAELKKQAFDLGSAITRSVELIAGATLSGALKTQAFDIGTKITRLVELVSTSTSIPNDLKGLAFGAAEDITRLVNLTAGSTLSDPLKAQAFGLGTEVLRTVSLYADSTSMPNDLKQQAFSAGTAISRVLNLAAYTGNPEFFKEAYAAGEDLNRAIVLAESSDMSADLKKLAIGQATEEFVRAVRATGSITADQRAVLNAVTGTVDKVLNTSATGGSMTSTQQAILYATGGTAYKELNTYVTGGSMTPGQQAILNAITGGSSSYVYMSGNVTFDPNNAMLSIFQAIQNQTYTTVQHLKAVHNALYYISRDQWTGGLLYAKGGVFTNSIVDTPTRFALGQMGEAGPEAIMPLHRDASGSLGVMARLQSPQQNNEVLVAEIRALRETNERMERRLASIEAASKATTLHTANTADSTRRMDTQGVMVFTDPAEPLSTQAA